MRQIIRIPHDRAMDMMISRHARECCMHFGVPYQARLLPLYRPEVRRLQAGDAPIGCLNQLWSGPLLVWYPDGNWMEVSDE